MQPPGSDRSQQSIREPSTIRHDYASSLREHALDGHANVDFDRAAYGDGHKSDTCSDDDVAVIQEMLNTVLHTKEYASAWRQSGSRGRT